MVEENQVKKPRPVNTDVVLERGPNILRGQRLPVNHWVEPGSLEKISPFGKVLVQALPIGDEAIVEILNKNNFPSTSF